MNKTRFPYRTIVLDSEGLSGAVLRDRRVWSWLKAAAKNDVPVYVSTVTLAEVVHPRIRSSALHWTLSKVTLRDVTPRVAHKATKLLAAAGRHGHGHAIDALVCATALSEEGPVAVLTSDPGDITTLTDKKVSVVKI
jgi:predicted nucleic acid-binding protein